MNQYIKDLATDVEYQGVVNNVTVILKTYFDKLNSSFIIDAKNKNVLLQFEIQKAGECILETLEEIFSLEFFERVKGAWNIEFEYTLI